MTESTPDRIYEKNGFLTINRYLPVPFCTFLREYFTTLKNNSKLEEGDAQVANSSCIYGDPCFDTLMLLSTPVLSNLIGTELVPTYTYGRIYYKGATLLPHIDREECEHSVTLSLGGEYSALWPIWMMDKNGQDKPEMCALDVGDMVIYKGNKIHHWRDEFEGSTQFQIFMHFVEKNGKYGDRIYDTRPNIGLPSSTKNPWTSSK